MSKPLRSVNLRATDRVELLKTTANVLKGRGVFHLVAQDDQLDGRKITLNQRALVNFGSCSYLGIETDSRLKTAACEAVLRFGSQFSSSRAYVSLPLYARLEAAMSAVFGGRPVVLASTTSLGHLAALPVLINEHDAVLYDAQVHNSVQAVLPTLREQGSPCEAVAHNRLDLVEARARELAANHARVFYLCDGVYSMHGDALDAPALFAMLDRNPRLNAYVDDAHGLGWTGKNGAGSVLGRHGGHERLVLAAGLSKGMAAAGAVIVTPNEELREKIFSCGSTMIFSGPMQPALLGAALASAQILLSPEIERLQAEVVERIELFDACVAREGLPLKGAASTPIRFLEIGDDATTVDMTAQLQNAGYFVNVAVFPAVARRHAGIRIMLNRNQTKEDIVGLTRELGRLLHRRERRLSCAPVSA